MYNNTTQTNPYLYGYNIPNYPRMMAPAPQEVQGMPATQNYAAPMMMQQINYIKGRPVVSIDEARASQIDLDGSLYVFPDLGNKKIYTKQINMDGTATFNIFELSGANSETASSNTEYITRTELEEALANLKATLMQNHAPEAATAPKTQPIKSFNL